MRKLVRRFAEWLHLRWPAGTVEKLPVVRDDFSTNVPGLFVVGDLTGVPLLKFAADSGAKAVQQIAGDAAFVAARTQKRDATMRDVAIVGGGVSGMSAALEAQKLGLDAEVFETAEPFATIADFPKQKPIFTYPAEMQPAGVLQITATVKETLLDELRRQTDAAGIVPTRARVETITIDPDGNGSGDGFAVKLADRNTVRARRVIVAIGRSGNFKKLGVPGEGGANVHHRLHDPADFHGQRVVVIGGGDSALEAATALAHAGAAVTLSYRRTEFSRAKAETIANLKAAPNLNLLLGTTVTAIDEASVMLTESRTNATHIVPAEAVFAMIGREAPLDFLRRCGIRIANDFTARFWLSLAAIFALCAAFYIWKATAWNPLNIGDAGEPGTLAHVLAGAMRDPGFFYAGAYSALVVIFGIRRIRRRKTPYVKWQTVSLAAVQIVPLFLLPYILLPWAGENGAFSGGGIGQFIGDEFFPNGDYWRAFGLIFAWPLFIYNTTSGAPMWGWLILGALQTFVLIPLLVWKWGKGAYCGWICSCGALAETLGDTHRHKMPHGPAWNRLNLAGQAILALAFLLLLWRILGWLMPGSFFAGSFDGLVMGYKWGVDVWLASIIGIGLYFHFSGRVWCRFFCPLAALMHIYARFSKFRIFADKKKCISCNICTSVCHQGIDVMSFANKGLPMADPQCVRCSACVQSCPTGVLEFGEIDTATGEKLRGAWLPASVNRSPATAAHHTAQASPTSSPPPHAEPSPIADAGKK